MKRRTIHRRGGFTLIELLVVIGIIILLMGLLLPAVMRVLGSGGKADTTARMTTIGQTISTFASGDPQFGNPGYIPAGQVDINPASPNFGKVIGPFRLRNSYTDPNWFEAQYIARVFGRVNLANLGNANLQGDLDANQTLLFFLGGIPEPDGQGGILFTGFSMNPQQPFAPKTNQDERRKGPLLELNNKRYQLPTGSRFARLTDGYGNPFAYFSAYDKKPGKMSGWNTTLNPALLPDRAYQNGGKYEHDTSFQLISAGKDGQFGTSGNWSAVGPAGQDDQANFTRNLLGAGQ